MIFLTMFLKPDTVGIIPRVGYGMGKRQTLKWMAYIGRSRNNVTHTRNGRQVHLTGVSNMKVGVYCSERNEVFEYRGCFGMGVLVCPIDTTQLATLKKHC
jgi:hypothetical protein